MKTKDWDKRIQRWQNRAAMLLFAMIVCACGEIVANNDGLLQSDAKELENLTEDSISFTPRQIIAHRGYHFGAEYPPNSVAAFKRALLLQDIYGTEFDVHETADGIMVVCHDATHADLQIKENTYATLCEHPLANGEPLPKLSDFLDVYAQTETNVKMIIELKSCNVEKLVSMVNDRLLDKQTEYISFSRNYCEKLTAMGHGEKTCYLSGNMTPQEVADAHFGGIDYSYAVLKEHPSWIDEAKALGLKTIVWTVNKKEDVIEFLSKGVIVTTDFPHINYEEQ